MERDKIGEIVRATVLDIAKKSDFTDHDNLLQSGVIDSLGTVKLITKLEENVNIKIAQCDITAENLSSVHSITRLVAEKL